MPSISTALKRPFPWVLIFVWAVISCLLSGAVAALFNMPSLWGSGNSIVEYMLPIPFSWGMLHYPSLGLFGFFLVLARSNTNQWLSIVRRLCVGSLLAVLAVVLLSDELRGFPLFMYFAVDAFTVLVFTAFIFGDTVENKKISIRMNLLLTLGPAFLVLLILFSAPIFMSRYNFAKSDTMDIDSKHDVVQFWLYLNHSAGEAKKECFYLKSYAEKRGNSYPRSNGLRHRKIILFKTQQAFLVGSPDSAWVSYEWWPDGRIDCSADPSFE